MKKDIDKKIDVFANSKIIATRADRMILKLIEAKAPLSIAGIKKETSKEKPKRKSPDHGASILPKAFYL